MRVLYLVMLAMALALFSTSAWGDGAPPDPTVRVQPGSGSTPTTDGGTAADPIFVAAGSGISDWLLDSATVASDGELFVEVVPSVGADLTFFNSEFWQCAADPPTTTACYEVNAQGTANGTLGITNGELIPGYGLEFVFIGPFTQGEDVGISVPEPRSAVLLLIGLVILFAFRPEKKRSISSLML